MIVFVTRLALPGSTAGFPVTWPPHCGAPCEPRYRKQAWCFLRQEEQDVPVQCDSTSCWASAAMECLRVKSRAILTLISQCTKISILQWNTTRSAGSKSRYFTILGLLCQIGRFESYGAGTNAKILSIVFSCFLFYIEHASVQAHSVTVTVLIAASQTQNPCSLCTALASPVTSRFSSCFLRRRSSRGAQLFFPRTIPFLFQAQAFFQFFLLVSC